MKLSEFAVNRPVTTSMMILSIVVLGLLSVNRIPLVFLPDVNRPNLRIYTSYQGSNPEEIERLITRPIEEIMGTVPGLKSMMSNSSASNSSVRLEFEEGHDMDMVSMEVRDRIDRVMPDLPNDLLDPPRIYRWQTTDWPILNFGLVWKGDPNLLEQVITEVVEKRLLAVEGVANVEVNGLKQKGIWIDLDMDMMRAARIDARELTGAVRDGNTNVPAGNVVSGGRRYNLRAIGQFRSIDEIAQLPLNSRGLRLEQVANVRYDFPEMRWFSRLNAQDAVSMAIRKTSNANIIDVNKRVIATLDQIKTDPRYAALDYQIYWDQSEAIVSSIDSLKSAGLMGAALAIAVLLFFLGNVRNTMVISISIPVSIICTFFFMYLSRMAPFNSELTLNIISMMGLIYAIGIVVDPAIVVLENIFRIRSEKKDIGPIEAAIQGSSEMGLAVMASILTNIIVFLPLIFLAGGRGMMRFMRDFGVVFCVVSLASLFVAFTVVPLLSARVVKKLDPGKERTFPRLNGFFSWLVTRALHHRMLTILVVVGILAGIVKLYGMIDKEGQQYSPERRMFIDVEVSHNYTMEQASKVMKGIEADLLARKDQLEIASVSNNLSMGRRNDGSFQIYFKDATKGSRTTAELEKAVQSLLPERPGFTYRYGHRGGSDGDVLEIDLSGERMELLQTYAENVRRLLSDIPGVDNIDLSTERGEQEVRVMVDRDRAATSGISTQQVAMTLSSQLGNRPAGRYKAAEREININMRLDEKDRLNLERLETLELYGPGGQMRDLKNLATVELGRGPRNIEKNDRLYTVEVYVPIRGGGGLYSLSNEVMKRMAGLKMAPGYYWSLGRNYQSMVETEQDSRFAIILSLVMIYILLAALFESFIHPFTILLSVPFAMIGVALIFVATKTNLGGISYIGIIIVCGLVVNNGIILVDYINQLRSQGLARRDAIILAVQKRLRPILMTAMTTVLSLLPMCAPLLAPGIFGPAEGRAAMWGPVGLAILGGMTTSTFLTLVITPTLYSLIDDLAQGGKSIAERVFSRKHPV
ncbi:efflux RND transporter permease subunit [bacterium]|nr:efflux RND transporter permease subunit [bacterium]